MVLVLYISLAVLLALQWKQWKIVNSLLVLGVAYLSVVVIVEHQTEIRMCHLEQESIASMFQGRTEDSDLYWAVVAADNYFADKRNATYENPFTGRFPDYMRELWDEAVD